MNWQPEATKPKTYITVLLSLAGGDYTTGHWSGSHWIGFRGDVSPPYYVLERENNG